MTVLDVRIEAWPFDDGVPGGFAVVRADQPSPTDQDYGGLIAYGPDWTAMDAVRWAESQMYRVVLR